MVIVGRDINLVKTTTQVETTTQVGTTTTETRTLTETRTQTVSESTVNIISTTASSFTVGFVLVGIVLAIPLFSRIRKRKM